MHDDKKKYFSRQELLHDHVYKLTRDINELRKENEILWKRLTDLENERFGAMEIYSTNNLSMTTISQMFPLHYTFEDINRKKQEYAVVANDYYSLRESLSKDNLEFLRNEVDKGKKELNDLQTIYDDNAYAIESLLQRIEEIKQSPLRRDLEIQQDKIKFLRAATGLQVEKYRGNKAEYRRIRKEKVVKGAKSMLEKTIIKENVSDNCRVVILHGLERGVTENDIRTLFDHYGTIYTVLISNEIAKIEFDTAVAAAKSLNCKSSIFRDIFIEENDYSESYSEDEFIDNQPESTIDPVSNSQQISYSSSMMSFSD